MTSEEIKRAGERYIAGKLTAAIGGTMKILSSTGGGETDDAVEIEPPFVVVTLNTAQNTTVLNVWYCQGSIQIVSHMAEYTPAQHANLAKIVENAFRGLDPEVVEATGLVFNGSDLTDTRYAENDDEKVRVTGLDFTSGMCG